MQLYVSLKLDFTFHRPVYVPALDNFEALELNCQKSALWEAEAGGSRDGDHPGQHGEIRSLQKIQKISRAWWFVPVIPAAREAEAGELLEPGRQRLK